MKKLCVLFALAFAFLVFLPGVARADVNNFVINDFHTDYEINNDKVGGSLKTTEQLDVTFTDNNHGILRALPMQNSGYDAKLQVLSVSRDGASEKYTTYKQNGNLVLKIGDPNSTVTGNHKYQIVYDQHRIISFSDGQEFYWDVNGDQWTQTFTKVSATVTIKNGDLNSMSPICYTGYRGSKDTKCKSKVIANNKVEISTDEPLLSNQTLTIGLKITGVEFIKPSTKDKIADNYLNIAGVIGGLIGSAFVLNFWRKNGKDYKGRGVIIPEYDPPKDLTPAEVGMLADYRVDGKDLSATLIDLAVRGYIKIHQDTSKVLFIKSQKFSLELIKTDFSTLKEHEKALIDGVFNTKIVGEIVALKDINKTKMSASVSDVNKKVQKSLMENYGLIDKKSNKLKSWMLIGGFIVAFGAGSLGFMPVGFRVGVGILGVVTILLGFAMDRRTHAGVETYEKIKGLELYMNTAEKDRLKMMQSVDRPYAGPEKTVDLFEKLLPFAVALGVEKSWAKQFDGILTQSPNWLSTNTGVFTANSLASSIAGVSTSFSSSFQTSSGASGGSSGGGGGGGGGGGW